MPAEVVQSPTATSPEKPKRAKKPRVVKERAKRTTPARTLRVRIAEIGPHHLAAFDIMCEQDAALPEKVREILDMKDEAHRIEAEIDATKQRCDVLLARSEEIKSRSMAMLPLFRILDAKASLVAKLHDDTPDAEDVSI